MNASPLSRYSFAILAVLLVLAVRSLLSSLVHQQAPLLPFTLAVMMSAWYGGFLPGLVTTALSMLTAAYFFLEPYHSLSGKDSAEIVSLVLFVGIGVGISYLSQNLLSSRRRAEANMAEAHRHQVISRQSEERYRMLFSAIDEGFCIIEMILDAKGQPADYRFLEINPAFEKQTGIASATGRTMRQIAPDHEAYWFEIYGRVSATGQATRFESEAKALNRWFDVYAFTRDGQANPRVAILFTDITERKRAEEALRNSVEREKEARSQAEQANRLKDEFVASVSHELRTPLSAIVGWSVMLRHKKFDEATIAKGLEVVERNARSQQQLIEDLMDISRAITGKLRLDLRAVELKPIIEAAVDAVHHAAESKQIRLHTSIDEPVGLVLGDSDRLQQIVWNLLSNAIKFTPSGGNVQIRLQRAYSHVNIVVEDTGQGIEPDFLPHVFDRFSQADRGSNRRYGGLGLGLAIVRHLVESHGGSVGVDSNGRDQGATFTVELPLIHKKDTAERGKPRQIAGQKAAVIECPPGLRDVHVLIVEDEADVANMLATMLEECGAVVTTATSVPEALKILDSNRPDVLVSDIGMPNDDGYKLIRQVRARRPEDGGQIPAAALTAYTSANHRQRALQAGFQIHIPKPVEPEEFVTVVASLAGRFAA